MNIVDQDTVNALQMVLGGMVPIILILWIKDTIANIWAGIQIKMKSEFQLHNNFEMRGRKCCRLSEQRLTHVVILDAESKQRMRMFNKDFVKESVWENEMNGQKRDFGK